MKPRAPSARALIRSFRNQRLGWPQALGELIDNACGNGARNVTIRLSKGRCEIRDDGVGCTPEKFAAMASIGGHEEDPLIVNPTSKYGIGAKHAFLWAGGPTRIYSRRGDLSLFMNVEWDDFTDAFDYDEPLTGEQASRECRLVKMDSDGVCIVMPSVTRKMDAGIFDSVIKTLNAQHWAAVEAGIVVRVEFFQSGKKKPRGGVLSGKQPPEFAEDHRINKVCTLADGRQIRLVGGVIATGVPWSTPGFEYIYGHRVVLTACGLGAGTMSFERLYVRVFLEGGKDDWNVTTNKHGLHDADEAALQEAVFRECRHLLACAEQEAIAMRSDSDEMFLGEVSDALTAGHRKKGKRDRNNKITEGTVQPSGKGSQHTRAKAVGVDPGNCTAGDRGSRKISIFPVEFEDEREFLIGEAKTKDWLVRLNKRHPMVAAALESRNKLATTIIADALWSDAFVSVDDHGQRSFVNGQMTFVDKLSAMLKVVPQEVEAEPTP